MKKIFFSFLLSCLAILPFRAQVLNVPTVEQEQDMWCWAGVCKSALDYYGFVNPQCVIAEYARQVSSRNFGNTPCCDNPTGPCNQGNSIYNESGSMADILNHFANITTIYKGQFSRTEQDVIDAIANNAVVPCGWTWSAGVGAGHAVLIHGYVNGNVYYMDPWFGEGKKIQTYAQFSSGNDGSGHHTWTQGIYITSDVSQVDTIPCAAPTNLTVTNPTSSSVNLSWSNVTEAQSYSVNYREVGGSNWSTLTAQSNTLLVNGLSSSTSYEFKVSSTCNSVSQSDFGNVVTATTLEGPLVYCNANGNSVTGEWIKQVVFGSINNLSNANGGYADFTAQSTSITAGSSANITLTPGFPSNWLYGTTTQPEFWGVWIDLNQDGDFNDANEQRYLSSTSSTAAVSASIAIPSGASVGTTRMRIAMKRSAAPGPCESFANGEVEDYSIEILAPASPTCDPVNNLAASNITTNSFTALWSASANATSYDVEFREAGSSWTLSSESNPSKDFTGLQEGANYEVRVTTVCSFGNSAVSSILSVTTGVTNPDYCASSGTTANEWIKSVAFGSINNTSNSNGGYADFTSLTNSIAAGQAQNITLTPGFPPAVLYGYITQPEFWSVWIDLNQDGDFNDAGELRFSSTASSTSAVNASISIPAGAALGTTRMRIAMKRNANAGPCENFASGEVEDYSIDIVSSLGGQSIASNEEATDVSAFACELYPNPSSEMVNVRIETPATAKEVMLVLTDLNGSRIQTKILSVSGSDGVLNQRLNIENLPQGVYLVNVLVDQNQLGCLKLIKK